MHSKGATRRRHGDELKAKVLSECDEAWRVSGRGGAVARLEREPGAQVAP
jgi:hypothetical protein